LFVNRPVGCAVRAGIPRVVDAMRAILNDPNTTWVLERRYYDEDKPPVRLKMHAAAVAFVGGKPVPRRPGSLGEDADYVDGRDDGTLILEPLGVKHHSADATVYGAFYTAKLTPETQERIRKLALTTSSFKESATVLAASRIRSDGFAALGARVAKTDVSDGAFEADPQRSAAKLVGTVVSARKISSSAAALYLQTLALAEPTKTNILRWNGWTAKDYDAAAKELVGKKLLVEASLPKAGRKHFLPGVVSKATTGRKAILNLPFEEWKRPFYPAESHFKHVIGEPCHTLFARAWHRVEGGDAPKR
jgi:hypothetical protein